MGRGGDIAFKAGVHVHETPAGVCEVHVPRDVRVEDCRLILRAGGKEGTCGKRECAATLEK